MRTLLLSLFVLSIIAVHTGCYYDNPSEIIIDEASFNKDVIPIFEASCLGVGCHEDGGPPPNLLPENAYAQLQGNNVQGIPYLNVQNPDESILMDELDSGSMPTSGKLPQAEIETVRKWMQDGALNN